MKNPKDNFIVDRFKSIGYALKGMWILISTENSIKAQISIMAVVSILGFLLDISTTEWIFQLFAFGMVITTEAVNTAIEKIANFIHPDFNSKIGVIKDVAAGAVAFASFTAIAIGLIIYIPKILEQF